MRFNFDDRSVKWKRSSASSRIAFRAMNMSAYNCASASAPVSPMAVAMVNSNAHSHLKKRGFYKDYSPCKVLFPSRFAVGIHHAEKDDLLRFQSQDGYHQFVSFQSNSCREMPTEIGPIFPELISENEVQHEQKFH